MNLEEALREAGSSPARLRGLVAAALEDGRAELAKPRSGYEEPVTVVVGEVAVAPVDAALRVDPGAAPVRGWLVAAALVRALVEAGEGEVRAGVFDGHLALQAPRLDPELATLAFNEAIEPVDRLRARALVVPEGVVAAHDLRALRGELRTAEAIARAGGDPLDPDAADAFEDTLDQTRPHEDPDPARRVARRILQRLSGMGKWGGYHTEFTHLPRGFAGNDRQLAAEVGEALIAAGLLAEKPSVGQRHVYLNPRRAGDIHRLVDEGAVPAGLKLPTLGR